MRPTVVAATVLLLTLISAPFAWGKPDLVLRPGQLFPVHVNGFYPRTTVELRLANSTRVSTRQANGAGVLNTVYQAPKVPGRYRLLVSGRPADDQYTPPHTRASSARRDYQTIIVVVPRLAIMPIVVRKPGGGVDPGSGHHPPAATGFDLRPYLISSAVLLIVGASFTIGARQGRRRTE